MPATVPRASRHLGAPFIVLVLLLAPLLVAPSVSAAADTTDVFVSRMTARWEPLTDSQGRTWDARSRTLGSDGRSALLVGTDIEGTDTDELYAVNAQGVTGYRLAVPVAGTYRVRLLMAEDWFTTAGRRVFDVHAEGQTAVEGVDIAGAVGRGAAHDVVFEPEVLDGQLDLEFVATVDRPLISAIEVTFVRYAQSARDSFVAHSTARWTPLTDAGGVVWAPRTGWTAETRTATTTLLSPPADGDARLYESMAFLTGYRTGVPGEGVYRVRLLFTENYWRDEGQRVFDVVAEGETRLEEVDAVRDAGHRTAGEVSFTVPVTDGSLDLEVVNRVDRAQISAIEVAYERPVPAPASVFTWRATAHSAPIVDTSGTRWEPQNTLFGGTNLSEGLFGQDIRGTEDDELYQRNIWGITRSMVPVPAPGVYRVRLLMAEDFFTQPGRRVFDVRAEGATAVSDVDIAGAVGSKHAYDVRFDVEVQDGELDLDFVKKVDNPLVSAIEVISASPVEATTQDVGPAVRFSPDSFYTQDISTAPLAADSAEIAANLAAQVSGAWNGVAGVNAYRYNTSFHRVPADQPKVRVGFSDCQSKGYTPWQLYDGPKHFVDVPVPADARAATGTDAEMSIYDPAADKIWEFWQMRRTSDGGWEACWGGRLDDVSTKQGYFDAPFGATATGLVMAGGMIGIDEAKAGKIDHAMYLGVIDARRFAQSWPANRNDGNSDAAHVPTQGQRLRLDPTIDVDRLGLTPFGTMVAKAAQTYGFVVSDRAGAVSVITESGRRVEAEAGRNPWDVLLGGPDYSALQGFPWQRLQALPVDYGRP